MRTSLVIIAMLFTATMASLSAQGNASDEKAVRSTVDQMIAAWNKGDAKAYAQHIADDFEEVTPEGTLVKGRAASEQMAAKEFAERKGTPKLNVTTSVVKFLKPDVAVTMGTWTLSGVQGVPEGALKGSFNATYVKQGGNWRAASALVATQPPTPPPAK
jgi:uncharacterized protein (TIGR02246 family)